MIKLYREENSLEADRIEAEFRDIILGFDREIMTPTEAAERLAQNTNCR